MNGMKSASDIVRASGMSDNPGFYSGRRAMLSDLDDRKLEKIYREINSQHGPDAAGQFVHMVANVPKLTATDFLLSLYSLEQNGWKFDRDALSDRKGIYPSSDGSALWTVASVLGGFGTVDDTSYIRNDFLRRHEYKPVR